MARPSRLTKLVHDRLVQALSLGSTIDLACKYAGISERVFYQWQVKANEQRSGKCVQLFQDLKEAEGRAAISWLAKIEKAANDGTWQAAAWKLERLHTESYGRKIRDHNVSVKAEVDVSEDARAAVNGLSVAKLRALEAALAETEDVD